MLLRRSARGAELYAAVLVAALVTIVFSFAPRASFLAWDDVAHLLDQERWRGLAWGNIRWMFSPRHYGPWQPLSWLSWAVDYSLWGLSPQAFRCTNIALHAMASGFFVLMCRRVLSAVVPDISESAVVFASVAAAVFFGLHPLRVESVVWITERRDVLSGLFVILSLWAWLEDRRGLSLAAFIGAVLSKGTAIAVLPFLFIWDVSILGRGTVQCLRALLPHAVVAALAAAINLYGLSAGYIPALQISLPDRLLVSLSGYSFYFFKTLLPFGLSPYYGLPLDIAAARSSFLPSALLTLIITAACFQRRVRAWAVPVWMSYLAALAPVSGLLQNGRQAAADRYSYLACMPFAILAAVAAARLYARQPRLTTGLFLGMVVFFAASTIRQSGFWRDDVALWSRAVAIDPEAYLPRSNLAVALLASGQKEAAVAHLQAAIRLEPRDVEARVNLAAVLDARGDRAGAEKFLREALSLRPGDPAAVVNLAGLRARDGDEKGARLLLESVVAQNPVFAAARFNLGVLLLKSGRKNDGLAQLREAVRLDPSLARRR